MKLKGLPISVTASILIGIIQNSLLLIVWAYFVAYSRHVPWLVDLGIVGPALYSIEYIVSFLVYVLLCLPAAYVICKLRPNRLNLYTVLAVLPSFVWANWLLISKPENLTLLPFWHGIIPSWTMMLIPIPLAVFITHRLTRRSSSFRPTASTGRSSTAPLN